MAEEAFDHTYFQGPCPFLFCDKAGPHSHAICPKCGAVWWGNAGCDECRRHWPERDIEIFGRVIDRHDDNAILP